GSNGAQNIGHINVLRIIRGPGGCALTITEEAIAAAIRDEWRERRFAWSPEGAATLAALPELADRGVIRPGNRVVLVNTASAEKYLPTTRDLFDGGFWPHLPPPPPRAGAAAPGTGLRPGSGTRARRPRRSARRRRGTARPSCRRGTGRPCGSSGRSPRPSGRRPRGTARS